MKHFSKRMTSARLIDLGDNFFPQACVSFKGLFYMPQSIKNVLLTISVAIEYLPNIDVLFRLSDSLSFIESAYLCSLGQKN